MAGPGRPQEWLGQGRGRRPARPGDRSSCGLLDQGRGPRRGLGARRDAPYGRSTALGDFFGWMAGSAGADALG